MLNYEFWGPELARGPQQAPLFWRKAYMPIYQRQKINQKGGADGRQFPFLKGGKRDLFFFGILLLDFF